MVNWNTPGLMEGCAVALWSISKDSFTAENKKMILEEISKVDNTITWNALR